MTSLNEYLKQVQRFLRDGRQDFLNPQDLIESINRARREVAMRSQSIRILTPISGQVMTATVAATGSGYVAGSVSVTISAPDFPSGQLPKPNGDQATALPIVQSGSIVGVEIQYGGYGYFQPQAGIVSSVGSGASVTLGITPILTLNQGQEEYAFSSVDLSPFPGVKEIHMVKSVSIIYANYRYSLPMYSFSTYQARIRQYPFQYQWVPTFACQRGQGSNGTFMVYPIPSQTYQMEWDAFCIPQDLEDDLSVEAIPEPWTEAVPYFAAYLAYLELQNHNAARLYLDLFEKMHLKYSGYARPGRATSPYGRW